jgi:hypothetical protein
MQVSNVFLWRYKHVYLGCSSWNVIAPVARTYQLNFAAIVSIIVALSDGNGSAYAAGFVKCWCFFFLPV